MFASSLEARREMQALVKAAYETAEAIEVLGGSSFPIFFQDRANREPPRPLSKPFAKCFIKHGETNRSLNSDISQARFEYRGLIILQIRVPPRDDGFDLAEKLANIGKRALSGATPNECRFYDARLFEHDPEINGTDPDPHVRNWFQFTVTAVFSYTEIRSGV